MTTTLPSPQDTFWSAGQYQADLSLIALGVTLFFQSIWFALVIESWQLWVAPLGEPDGPSKES